MGIVYGGIKQTIANNNGNELATYHTTEAGYLPIKTFLPKVAIRSIAPMALMVLNISGGLASILSFFGLTAGGITLVQLLTWLLIIGLAIFPLLALRIVIGASLSEHYRFGPWRYEMADNFLIRVLKTTGECAVEGCSGDLELKKPKANKEEVELAGFCTRRPGLHIFDFDEKKQKGKRLHLTFINEDKK